MLPTHLIHVSVTLTGPYLIILLILYYGQDRKDNTSLESPLTRRPPELRSQISDTLRT
jgi:hypothetical protein